MWLENDLAVEDYSRIRIPVYRIQADITLLLSCHILVQGSGRGLNTNGLLVFAILMGLKMAVLIKTVAVWTGTWLHAY